MAKSKSSEKSLPRTMELSVSRNCLNKDCLDHLLLDIAVGDMVTRLECNEARWTNEHRLTFSLRTESLLTLLIQTISLFAEKQLQKRLQRLLSVVDQLSKSTPTPPP